MNFKHTAHFRGSGKKCPERAKDVVVHKYVTYRHRHMRSPVPKNLGEVELRQSGTSPSDCPLWNTMSASTNASNKPGIAQASSKTSKDCDLASTAVRQRARGRSGDVASSSTRRRQPMPPLRSVMEYRAPSRVRMRDRKFDVPVAPEVVRGSHSLHLTLRFLFFLSSPAQNRTRGLARSHLSRASSSSCSL